MSRYLLAYWKQLLLQKREVTKVFRMASLVEGLTLHKSLNLLQTLSLQHKRQHVEVSTNLNIWSSTKNYQHAL